jgi:hypothetical protein
MRDKRHTGENMSILEALHVNDVIALTYGDTEEEQIGRVVAVRDMRKDPVTTGPLAYCKPTGKYLITCNVAGKGYRSFYSGKERTARLVLLNERIRRRGTLTLPPRV